MRAVNLDRLAGALAPPFDHAWRAVQHLENQDIVRVDNQTDRAPRVPAAADPTNARSWYATSRSRVANGLLLTAPGIPMLFMGQEILEDKYWSDSPDYFADSLIWWDGLRRRSSHAGSSAFRAGSHRRAAQLPRAHERLDPRLSRAQRQSRDRVSPMGGWSGRRCRGSRQFSARRPGIRIRWDSRDSERGSRSSTATSTRTFPIPSRSATRVELSPPVRRCTDLLSRRRLYCRRIRFSCFRPAE